MALNHRFAQDGRRVRRTRRSAGLSAAVLLALAGLGAAPAGAAWAAPKSAAGSVTVIAPLVPGDEPVVVTQHVVQTRSGPLAYEARAGRLPIRDAETGAVHGHVFFIAYVVKAKGPPRPLTFAWNGGPTVVSWPINTEGLGPRRSSRTGMSDNPDTLLQTSDLVFYDPIETGFSRPESPQFAPEFFTLRGDVAATAEFIRAYRQRFRTGAQPTFIAGESYGVFRAAALSDLMTDRDEKLAGTILISGDIPNVAQPVAFYDAMHIPARTATAFFYKRLTPELMKDRAATLAEVNTWASQVYMPALQRIDTLSPAERETIAHELAKYIGMRPDQVDRKTLVVHAKQYLEGFFDGDGTKTLSEEDTRVLAADEYFFAPQPVIDGYLRDELGYATDLSYSSVETGYTPSPGPKFRGPGAQFSYDIGMSQADVALGNRYGEVTWGARDNPPWMQTAMTRSKGLRLFVATGRFDPLNMCEGDVKVTAQLPPDLSSRIENHCYEGGHLMYRDAASRTALSADITAFIRATVAAQAAGKP